MTKESKKVLLGAGLVGLGIYAYFSYKKYAKVAKKATKVKEADNKEIIDDDEFDDDLDLDSERIDEIIKDITDIPDDEDEGSNDGREETVSSNNEKNQEYNGGEDILDESSVDEDDEDDDDEEDIWNTGWSEDDDDEEEGFYPMAFEAACREMIDCAVAYKTKVIDIFDYEDDGDTEMYAAQLFHLFYVYVNQLLASYVTYGASELQRNLDRFRIVYRMFLYMLDSRGILELEKQYFEEIKKESLIDPQKCRFSMGEAANIICDMAEEYIDLNDGIIDFEFALENFPYVKDEDIDKAEEGEEETVDAGDEEIKEENDTEEATPSELAPVSENNSGPAPQKMRPKNKKNRRSRR